MKTIYKVQNLETGDAMFCLKKKLDETINFMEAQIRIDYMHHMSLTPHQAAMPDELAGMIDKIADVLEINKFQHEELLIEELN